ARLLLPPSSPRRARSARHELIPLGRPAEHAFAREIGAPARVLVNQMSDGAALELGNEEFGDGRLPGDLSPAIHAFDPAANEPADDVDQVDAVVHDAPPGPTGAALRVVREAHRLVAIDALAAEQRLDQELDLA